MAVRETRLLPHPRWLPWGISVPSVQDPAATAHHGPSYVSAARNLGSPAAGAACRERHRHPEVCRAAWVSAAAPSRFEFCLTSCIGSSRTTPPPAIPRSASSPKPPFPGPPTSLYTNSAPQIAPFLIYPSPCTRINLPRFNRFWASCSSCPPVHELSPQTLLFPGYPLFSQYTNWPPWVRQFPEPPRSLTRQFHLPRFSSFQAPLVALYTGTSHRFCCF